MTSNDINSALRIDLRPVEDDGRGSFISTATESPQHKRPLVRENPLALSVQGRLVAVIHGTLSSREPASLIITDFEFAPNTKVQRLLSATITYTFEGVKPTSHGPTLLSIAPEYLSIKRTNTDMDIRRPGVSARSSTTTDESISGKKWDSEDGPMVVSQTTVAGITKWGSRQFDGPDTARWVLEENPEEKNGIPTFLRTAVLILRENKEADDPFKAGVEITVELISNSLTKGSVRKMAGKSAIDDPIVFLPNRTQEFKDGMIIDSRRLDKVDLDEIYRLASV